LTDRAPKVVDNKRSPIDGDTMVLSRPLRGETRNKFSLGGLEQRHDFEVAVNVPRPTPPDQVGRLQDFLGGERTQRMLFRWDAARGLLCARCRKGVGIMSCGHCYQLGVADEEGNVKSSRASDPEWQQLENEI
jgi:hypothetical protein